MVIHKIINFKRNTKYLICEGLEFARLKEVHLQVLPLCNHLLLHIDYST